eukprot:COSAG01_NODE_3587_length_5905_cov_36.428522_8_plen_57_part_00
MRYTNLWKAKHRCFPNQSQPPIFKVGPMYLIASNYQHVLTVPLIHVAATCELPFLT